MKVLLFLAEGFEDLEAVSVLDILGWTQYREWVPSVEVVTTGFHPAINSRFGLVMKPDIALDQIRAEDYAALALPGGFHSHGFDEVYDDRVRVLASAIHRQGGWLATFCVGVLPVAEAGLLKGRRAVTYPYSRQHDNPGRLQALGAIVTDHAVSVDDRIISCQGPGAALEVSYRLLDALIGREHGAEVRRLMCAPRPSPA